MKDLRYTETNSADDSEGRTWGLEGNLFWFLVGGVFASVILLLMLYSMWRWDFAEATAAASIPLILSLIYVFGIRHGRPPGHDRDLLDLWLHGRGFGPETHTHTQSDFYE